MSDFEQLNKIEYNDFRFKVYRDEEDKRLTDKDVKAPMESSELFDKFQQRVEQDSTFENRTRYYFEDQNLIDAKKERYRAIGRNDRKLNEFSAAHKNHKAVRYDAIWPI